MRYAQLVMGPAGSGKSTYCTAIAQHMENEGKICKVINLDPAAEVFDYKPIADIRDLIQVDDAMEDEELHFGPNGGLVFCMEYLLENIEWLEEILTDEDEDYFLFDCPGQIELYTHLPIMRKLVDKLESWNFRICSVFLLDAQFMVDSGKFISGSMAALSAMLNLELSHVNVLSKMDQLSKSARSQLETYLLPDTKALLTSLENGPGSKKYFKFTKAIGELLDDFSLVNFIPLNLTKEESVSDYLLTVDNILQCNEDQDIKTKDFEEADPD